MIQQSRMFSDLVVLHEYAHVLQHHISSASSWASVHLGCAMRLTPGGTLINSPEYAWTEAFAAYYVHAVRRAYAAEPSLDGFASTATGSIESSQSPARTSQRHLRGAVSSVETLTTDLPLLLGGRQRVNEDF